MAISRNIKLFSFTKPYISNQHGAIITLIFVNFIAVLHSAQLHTFQIFALIFSLTAFHSMEILLLSKHQRKYLKTAFWVYASLAVFSGLFVVAYQTQLPMLLAGLALLSTLFFIARAYSNAKTFFHLVSFALLIWISLFGLITPQAKVIFNLFIQLLIYFSFTVAFIHWRLGKIPFQTLQVLALICLILCGILLPWKGMTALVIVLIAKCLMIYFSKNYWQKAPLKVLGYEETISLSVYIILMTFI